MPSSPQVHGQMNKFTSLIAIKYGCMWHNSPGGSPNIIGRFSLVQLKNNVIHYLFSTVFLLAPRTIHRRKGETVGRIGANESVLHAEFAAGARSHRQIGSNGRTRHLGVAHKSPSVCCLHHTKRSLMNSITDGQPEGVVGGIGVL